MSDWTSGYVSDIGYTFGYYRELCPTHAKQAFLTQGLVFPEVKTACELGFGQGLSAVVHGSASNIEWYGTDFNPAQASFASGLAANAGSPCSLYDDSFQEFLERKDLPNFDFIGLHGVWSWISSENQKAIIEFVKQKLNLGGVLYISYNTLPGWSAFAPMRHLMTQHANIIGSEGEGIVNRIDGAVRFAEELLKSEPNYLKNNPSVAKRLERMRGLNRHYLAHEYFNKDWNPIHFETMASELESAKLTYACSAAMGEHIDIINVSDEQQELLSKISDPVLNQSVRDFMTDQQFRRDYWVKGLQKISRVEQLEQFRLLRVMLTKHKSDIELKISGMRGSITLKEEIYNPIIDYLALNPSTKISDLESELSKKGFDIATIFQAVNILIAKEAVVCLQDDAACQESIDNAKALNRSIMAQSKYGVDINVLASPITGSGLQFSRIHQLFILASLDGKKSPIDWAAFAWEHLQQIGQKLIKDGKAFEDEEDNLAELKRLAEEFKSKGFNLARNSLII